jgi:hypothetical protein
LEPVAGRTPVIEAARPVDLASELAPFGAGLTRGSGLAWPLALGLGGLLIALMCLDAVGAGPRHDYLRRRAGRRPPPWR